MSSSLWAMWRTNWNIAAARNSECSGLNFVALPSSSHVARVVPAINQSWMRQPKVHVSITKHSLSFFLVRNSKKFNISRKFLFFSFKTFEWQFAVVCVKVILSLVSKSYDNSLEDIEKLSDALFHSIQPYRKEDQTRKEKKKMKFNVSI
jgi:hypothetical protein